MSHHSGSVRICWTKITKFKGLFFACTCLGFFPTFRLWAWCSGTGDAVWFFSRHFAVEHHLQSLCKHFKSIHGSMWCIADLAPLLPHVLESFYQLCFVSSHFCPRSWPLSAPGLVWACLPGSSCPTQSFPALSNKSKGSPQVPSSRSVAPSQPLNRYAC